jgi:hypothetical protein
MAQVFIEFAAMDVWRTTEHRRRGAGSKASTIALCSKYHS